MATRFTFEGAEIYDLRSIRDKMKDIMSAKKLSQRKTRARAFADSYRAVDENADGNMGQAAGYLGDRYIEACALFGVAHPIFGDEDPRVAGERMLNEEFGYDQEDAPE